MIFLRTVLIAIGLAAWFLVAGCSGKSSPRLDPRDRNSKWVKVEERDARKAAKFIPAGENPSIETGIASWYGVKFHGRRTANGEIYDMSRLTAAHRTLPFHSIVEVVNLDNRKKIIVRINDRGPFVKNRIIDLSFKAAKILGMAERGTAPVELRIIKPGVSRLDQDDFFAGRAFRIQAGAFSREENARRLLWL